MDKVCEYCGETYETWWETGKKQKYCSRECASKSKLDRTVLICRKCHKEFEVVNSLKKQVYCSRECFFADKYGEKRLRNTQKLDEGIRNLIKERDTFRCQFCNQKENDRDTVYGFIVHHIDGNRRNNELTNLITLCHPCHRFIHAKKGNPRYLQQKLKLFL